MPLRHNLNLLAKKPLILLIVITGGFFSLSILAFLGYLSVAYKSFYVPSGSMEPTLKINDRLLANRLAYDSRLPQRGDIIVFEITEALRKRNFQGTFLGRVVGLPEDKIELKEGKVYVNNTVLTENYLQEKETEIFCLPEDRPYLTQPVVIPENSYLVLGDNRDNSYDGRCWGVVPEEKIIGKIVFRYFPFKRFGSLNEK
ncbi:signal peptidase I [Oscillatoria salina]|uniref:signal peptidase I n=1 Tax=Oscillatoria salina TaxID=331517 RepID=UPI0013BB5CB3|nr:signal peptidase I [Oscillatoria salina]MBZ8179110.1 signal peptidase I [Oscillatoria salina IIICB1]NET87017.1 signal peptidase I [Kamptonema sp. SIO1D9]